MKEKSDIVILGGGPGGYVAAIRGAQLKKSVVLIEKDKLGGTCMNYGCIPAKYLLNQTKNYKELKENKNIEGPLEEIKCNWKKVQEKKGIIVKKLVSGLEFLLRKNGVKIVKGTGSLKKKYQVVAEVEGEENIFESSKIIIAAGSRPGELPFLEPNRQHAVLEYFRNGEK